MSIVSTKSLIKLKSIIHAFITSQQDYSNSPQLCINKVSIFVLNQAARFLNTHYTTFTL